MTQSCNRAAAAAKRLPAAAKISGRQRRGRGRPTLPPRVLGHEAVVVYREDVALARHQEPEAAAGGVLERDAPRLVAKDALDVVAGSRRRSGVLEAGGLGVGGRAGAGSGKCVEGAPAPADRPRARRDFRASKREPSRGFTQSAPPQAGPLGLTGCTARSQSPRARGWCGTGRRPGVVTWDAAGSGARKTCAPLKKGTHRHGTERHAGSTGAARHPPSPAR